MPACVGCAPQIRHAGAVGSGTTRARAHGGNAAETGRRSPRRESASEHVPCRRGGSEALARAHCQPQIDAVRRRKRRCGAVPCAPNVEKPQRGRKILAQWPAGAHLRRESEARVRGRTSNWERHKSHRSGNSAGRFSHNSKTIMRLMYLALPLPGCVCCRATAKKL